MVIARLLVNIVLISALLIGVGYIGYRYLLTPAYIRIELPASYKFLPPTECQFTYTDSFSTRTGVIHVANGILVMEISGVGWDRGTYRIRVDTTVGEITSRQVGAGAAQVLSLDQLLERVKTYFDGADMGTIMSCSPWWNSDVRILDHL